MTVVEIVILLIGFIANAFVPEMAFRYVCWKQNKRKQPLPEKNEKELLYVALLGEAVYLALGIYWCLRFETVMVFLNILFYGFALFGTYVDAKIRIIGNEMLKAMLVLTMIYKVVTYGSLADIWLSLAGFGVTVALFAAAAALNYMHRGTMGVGMGDIKLAMIGGLLAGWPGVLDMLLGFSVTLVGYVLVVPMLFRQSGVYLPAKLSDHFAMCMSLMAGILFYLSNV